MWCTYTSMKIISSQKFLGHCLAISGDHFLRLKLFTVGELPANCHGTFPKLYFINISLSHSSWKASYAFFFHLAIDFRWKNGNLTQRIIIRTGESITNFASICDSTLTVWCREEATGDKDWRKLCYEAGASAINCKHSRSNGPWDSTVCHQLLQWFFRAGFLFWGTMKLSFSMLDSTLFPKERQYSQLPKVGQSIISSGKFLPRVIEPMTATVDCYDWILPSYEPVAKI